MGFATLYPSYSGLSGETPRRHETASIPLRENIPIYRNSELRHMSNQPGPRKRGGSPVVRNAGRVAVDAAASAREVRAGRIALREPEASRGRAALSGSSRQHSSGNVDNAGR